MDSLHIHDYRELSEYIFINLLHANSIHFDDEPKQTYSSYQAATTSIISSYMMINSIGNTDVFRFSLKEADKAIEHIQYIFKGLSMKLIDEHNWIIRKEVVIL